ncbi:MAG: ABC transporter permease [Sandaracinaceae bacterium]
MKRLLGLVEKELSHHTLVLGGISALLFVIWGLLLLGHTVTPRALTMLEVHATFVRVFVPVLGVALGRRLVIREYYAHTQRFLEALPVGRDEVLAVKWLGGAVALLVPSLVSLAATALVASFREPLEVWWLTLIALRTVSAVLALWSFLFVMGLLGRWRVPLYLAIGVVLLLLDRTTDVQLSRFGPFALVGEAFVLERQHVPLAALGWTAGLGMGLLVLSLVLVLVREGSVVEAMSARMSRRDKAAVGVALLAALVAFQFVDDKSEVTPFAFEGDAERRPGVEVLLVSDSPEERGRAGALADRVHGDLARLSAVLRVDTLPPVYIAPRSALDAHEMEAVTLDEGQEAVLVRALFTDADGSNARLRAFVLSRVMERLTDGRAGFEPVAWVRSALAWRLVSPDAPQSARLAGWAARRRRPSVSLLLRRRRTEERFGEAVAEALAGVAADAIAARSSEAEFFAFAGEVIGNAPPSPFTVLFSRPDSLSVLERVTGMGTTELEAAWRARLSPPDLPVMNSHVVIREEGALGVLVWRVDGAPSDAECRLLHAPLGPFDVPVTAPIIERTSCGRTPSPLLGRYGSGDRVFLAVEVVEPTLGVPLRLEAGRRRLP